MCRDEVEIRRGPRGQAEGMETDDSELHAKVQKPQTHLHHHLDNQHSHHHHVKVQKPHIHYFHHYMDHHDHSRHQRQSIPDICHEPTSEARVKFFWLV